MKRYKVIALSVMGRRKIYHSGETVKESSFDTGRAAQLVEKGFLQPIIEEGNEEIVSDKPEGDIKPEGEQTPPTAEGAGTEGGTPPPQGTEGTGTEPPAGEKTVDDYTKNEIMDNLKILGIEFKPQASKQELFDLWNASIKK